MEFLCGQLSYSGTATPFHWFPQAAQENSPSKSLYSAPGAGNSRCHPQPPTMQLVVALFIGSIGTPSQDPFSWKTVKGLCCLHALLSGMHSFCLSSAELQGSITNKSLMLSGGVHGFLLSTPSQEAIVPQHTPVSKTEQ
jgi:hypothetical protein